MSAPVERIALAVTGRAVDAVTAAVHRPEETQSPAFLLAPGAGGDLDFAPLVAFAEGLAAAGHLVVRCNLPYREAGRRSPPRAEQAAGAYQEIAGAARQAVGGRWSEPGDWVVGGKSFGGRVASLAVAAGLGARGLCFYGYPLHAPGRADQLRVAHWPDIAVPCLFLQGTRDRFCDLEPLRASLRHLPRRARLEVVEGGDHSLAVSRAAAPDGVARSAEEVLPELAEVAAAWARAIE